MTSFKLYHNPQCSKSREALELIKTAQVNCEVIEYLKTPLTKEEVASLIHDLKNPTSELVRVKESEFKDDPFDITSAEVIAEQIAKKPRLLERPILWSSSHGAVIGRPMERITELLKL